MRYLGNFSLDQYSPQRKTANFQYFFQCNECNSSCLLARNLHRFLVFTQSRRSGSGTQINSNRQILHKKLQNFGINTFYLIRQRIENTFNSLYQHLLLAIITLVDVAIFDYEIKWTGLFPNWLFAGGYAIMTVLIYIYGGKNVSYKNLQYIFSMIYF